LSVRYEGDSISAVPQKVVGLHMNSTPHERHLRVIAVVAAYAYAFSIGVNLSLMALETVELST